MPQIRRIVPGLVAPLAVLLALVSTLQAQPAKKPPASASDGNEPPVLLEPPKTEEELVNAALLMQQLSRPNLSTKYLTILLKKNPDDATLLKLHDRFGSAKFLQLARVPNDRDKIIGGIGATPAVGLDIFKNPGKELLRRVNVAVRKRATDPKYVDSLINGLAGDSEERAAAIVMLRNVGPTALPRMFERISSAPAAQASSFQTALVAYGQSAVPVLVAALNSSNTKLQTVAASSLGQIRNPMVVPYLWYFKSYKQTPEGLKTASREALARILKTDATEIDKVAPESVAGELKKLAVQHFRGEHQWKVGADKQVEFWYWDSASKKIASKKTTTRIASLYTGTRFSRMALNLSSENEDAQALFVAMSLSAAADPTWQKPLPTGRGTAYFGALNAGRKTVLDALKLSMQHGDAAATIGCLLVMKQLGKKSDLQGRNSPIVQAMSFPDSRVQFAAAATILTIDPDERFRGSTRVVAILSRALNDSGSPTGLVIHSNLQKGSSIAGLLTQMGYDPQVAATGRDGFKVAVSQGDVALILLPANTIRWPLTQTVANLRADSRTKSIPIAVFGPASLQDKVKRKLRYYNRTTYVTESITSRHLRMQLDPFLASIKSAPLSPTQRTARKAAAASWLAFVASGKRSAIYDLRSAESALVASVTDEQLTADVVRTLGAIPTKRSQAAIHSVVVNANANAGNRTVAARQLASHIRQYGLLLSDSQVAALKNLPTDLKDNGRFATAAAAIQGLLKPDAKRVGNSLRTIPLPKLEK